MTAIPPSRYKVVERGRRLVVIDTHTGQPATREPARLPPVSIGNDENLAMSRPARTVDDKSGKAVIRTSRLYDLKGPREIVVGDNLTPLFGGGTVTVIVAMVVFVALALSFPLLWALPLLLFQPRARNALRSAVTVWLDSVDQAVF